MSRQHYIINDETMYIVAKFNGRYIESQVGELYGEPIECNAMPNKIIEQNCRYHFQTYTSRKELTRSLSGIRSKHPIILDLFGAYVYFCTHSDRVSENNWFNLKYIQSYYEYNGNTKIKFENNEEMEIDISYSSFNNQYLNAVKLHYKFGLAKEKNYRKNEEARMPYEHGHQELQYINEAARDSYMNYIRGIDNINKVWTKNVSVFNNYIKVVNFN